MNAILGIAQLRAAATYNAAADSFDSVPLGFWHRHGTKTVASLDLMPGAEVLDVGCGSGASAVPAAKAVGPDGHVTGIDVAENMLRLAIRKAHFAGVRNITFQMADMTASGFPAHHFDTVIANHAIFFVPDMKALVAELWRMVKPGGQLAVTVWAKDPFEPAAAIFTQELMHVCPDMDAPKRPWVRLTAPNDLAQLFADSGAATPVITHLEDVQPLMRPDDFWTVANGSGFRREIDQLSHQERTLFRERVARRLSQANCTAINTSALIAVATRPL
ncbi:MAG: methyltransferase domain-containing protein [Devosia sp.]